MNRIDRIFADKRRQGGKALMPFLTAGDPDLKTTAALLHVAQEAGCSICELGFPFSDPIADGPTIQASMARALDHGVNTRAILEMVAAERDRLDIGLVAMVSYSIVFRHSPADFIARAKSAGIDGLIIPDLSLEASAPVREAAADAGLICSFLIAPSTPIERARELAQASSGFVYLLARAGITGERQSLPEDLSARVASLRSVTDLPIAIGFGISTAEQVSEVVQVADAAIVGSAIVRRITEAQSDGTPHVVDHVRPFITALAGGLRSGAVAD